MRLSLSHLAGAALVDVTLKALLAVVIAGLVAALLRKTAASTRHAIWLTSTVILLMLPIAAVALPQFSLPLLPAEPVATETEAKPLDIQPRQLSPQAASNAPLQHTIVAGASGLFATVRSWSMAGVVVWGAGALLMIVRAAVGFVRLHYRYRDEPSKGGSIGNHPDQALVRKFLGLHPTPDKMADVGKSIGTNASRTDNPKVWTMTQSMRSDSIRVGLGRRSVKGELDWLERGKDFSYDETLATITLLRESVLLKEAPAMSQDDLLARLRRIDEIPAAAESKAVRWGRTIVTQVTSRVRRWRQSFGLS